MLTCTTSQPQLFPPPYLVSRFAKADRVVWLSQAQYQSGQFMSEFQVQAKKGTQGLSLPLVRPTESRPCVADVLVREPVQAKDAILREFRRAYAAATHRETALQVLDYCLQPMGRLYDLVVCSSNRLHEALGLRLTSTNDFSLLSCRPEDPSEWLAELSRRSGAGLYFQGKAAIDSYLKRAAFLPIRVGFQVFPELPSSKLSVLHYLAVLGLPLTQSLCSADRTTVSLYEDSV